MFRWPSSWGDVTLRIQPLWSPAPSVTTGWFTSSVNTWNYLSVATEAAAPLLTSSASKENPLIPKGDLASANTACWTIPQWGNSWSSPRDNNRTNFTAIHDAQLNRQEDHTQPYCAQADYSRVKLIHTTKPRNSSTLTQAGWAPFTSTGFPGSGATLGEPSVLPACYPTTVVTSLYQGSFPTQVHHVYILRSLRSECKFYIGYSTDIIHRLRQHNRVIGGGAKRTARYGPWTFIAVIRGFGDNHQALRFEARLQHNRKRANDTRLRHVEKIITTLVHANDRAHEKGGPRCAWPLLSITWYCEHRNDGGYVAHPNVVNYYEPVLTVEQE